MNLYVEEIVKACQGVWQVRTKEEDSKVSCVVIDSRKIEEKGVFIATKGERVDGHSFLPSVFEKGAVLAIGEKSKVEVEAEFGFAVTGNYVQVPDAFVALKQIAMVYREKLSIPFVGITGSVGKTSTKEFVSKVLEEHFNVHKTQGNYNNEIGVPLTLLQIREEHTAAVIEMGISDFGEMHRLSEMARPDVCVITNIGQCHLENLKTRDGILQAKTEIFDFMNPDGQVVLNGDDDKLITVSEVNGRKPFFFSIQGATCEVQAKDIVNEGLLGSRVTLCGEFQGTFEEFQVKVPLPGIHMVKNAACAATVASILGLSKEEVVAGLSKLTATKGRGEIKQLGNLMVIDECYNANPASMEAALELLSMANTTKVAILGDMFELGENSKALHEKVGELATKSGADVILLSGENSQAMYENAKKTASSGQQIIYYPTREQLLDAIKQDELIPAGSAVLLKASHGMHYEEILRYFEEASVLDSSKPIS